MLENTREMKLTHMANAPKPKRERARATKRTEWNGAEKYIEYEEIVHLMFG